MEKVWMKYKKSCMLALAVLVLLSFVFGAQEELPMQKLMSSFSENAVLTDGDAQACSIQSVDEVCSAVYHATLLRRISCRGLIRNVRFLTLALIVLAEAVALLFGAVCFLILYPIQGRIILIHYIHNSDGKK